MNQAILYPDQHILIVDDNLSNLLVLNLILKSCNVAKIYQAASAKAAYKIVEEERIDAILLDVNMPEINGIEACKTIRSNARYNRIPILMVTADQDSETLKKSFESGANDFIEKPVNSTVLMIRLNAQLKERELEKKGREISQFRAKDEIISMLAHQWRQPLNHINVLVTSIKAGIELEMIGERDILSSLTEVEGAVKSLSELISSFSSVFSQNKSTFPTNVDALIDHLLHSLEPLLKSNNVFIQRTSTDALLFDLDQSALQQVLFNILTNSIDAFTDFSCQSPTIWVETSSTGGEFEIKIIDNGKGIKREHLPHLFDPYFTTKEERNGKGLGLYIAKQLLDYKLSGTLEVISEEALTTVSIHIENPHPPQNGEFGKPPQLHN